MDSGLAATLVTVGLQLDVAPPVATVTLNRPERRNAQTPAMWAALAQIGRELSGDVRVVVLRGAGVGFSAGLDLAMFTPEGLPDTPTFLDMARMPERDAEAIIATYQDAFMWWSRPDIVSVAAVQGHAIGAGFQLALGCDLRVLADDAQLTMAEVPRGIVPDLGGTGALIDLVGYPRALEICATGRRVGAEEALRIGLAELVVPRAELDEAVSDLVAALLASPRNAVVEVKALLRGARVRGSRDRMAAERQAQVRRIRDLAGLGD